MSTPPSANEIVATFPDKTHVTRSTVTSAMLFGVVEASYRAYEDTRANELTLHFRAHVMIERNNENSIRAWKAIAALFVVAGVPSTAEAELYEKCLAMAKRGSSEIVHYGNVKVLLVPAQDKFSMIRATVSYAARGPALGEGGRTEGNAS